MSEAMVRALRADECAGVLELWKQLRAKPTVTDTVEYLQALVSRNGDLFLVAEISGSIVGTVLGGWDGWRGHIYRLAVHPEHRHRGIARTLVEEVEQRLRERGARRIYALSDTQDGVRFWSASPYEVTTDASFVRTY